MVVVVISPPIILVVLSLERRMPSSTSFPGIESTPFVCIMPFPSLFVVVVVVDEDDGGGGEEEVNW